MIPSQVEQKSNLFPLLLGSCRPFFLSFFRSSLFFSSFIFKFLPFPSIVFLPVLFLRSRGRLFAGTDLDCNSVAEDVGHWSMTERVFSKPNREK